MSQTVQLRKAEWKSQTCSHFDKSEPNRRRRKSRRDEEKKTSVKPYVIGPGGRKGWKREDRKAATKSEVTHK